MPIITGDKIWVESCLSDAEWKEYFSKYPSVCSKEKPQEFDCEFKWRHRMGESATPQEIENIKANIAYLLKHNHVSTKTISNP